MSNDKNTPPPPNSQAALRRLLVVLAVVIGFVIYSYGWTVTEIDFARPQEETRQQNVQNALRELLSPRIFEQEREVIEVSAPFLMECDDAVSVPDPDRVEGQGYVTVTPNCGSPGDIIQIEVADFEPGADTRIRWVPVEGQTRPREVLETGREELVLGPSGGFSGTIQVPTIRGSEGEIHTIAVRAAIPVGPIVLSSSTRVVFQRMLETIFMALVATTVAIPVGVIISFLAARNIMRPLKLTLGSLMLVFISLVIGWWLGSELLSPVARTGVNMGKAETSGPMMAFLVPGLVIVATAFTTRFGASLELEGISDKARAIILKLILTVATLFVMGALGGLAILGGQQIMQLGQSIDVTLLGGSIEAIGRFLRLLGELTEIIVPVLAAVGGAFVVSSVASDLLAAPLREVKSVLNYALGGLLGAIGGGILMMMMGSLGLSAALLGLFSPFVAAMLGGQLAITIYRRIRWYLAGERTWRFGAQQIDETLRLVLFLGGALVMFTFTFNYLFLGRALVDGTLPQQTPINILGVELAEYVAKSALIGVILGGLMGALSGVRANFPIGSLVYNSARAALNSVRSIEPLIMGLVFVIWVGIGPFAGVLALTLHSIAALGKLYSEQVENIDPGPSEALQSTGASWLQTVVYAVVPQVIPPYIAFTMYRWDINVRMSTIIGFVGGGGIGLLLQQQINLLRYREAGVAVLAIAIVVSILDYASASIRERLV